VHNTQAAPDGRTVWTTAMPASGHAGHDGAGAEEELIGIDAWTLAVEDRIHLGAGLHAAHVVMSGTDAYVTANQADQVIVVDLAGRRVRRAIALPPGTGPHGARLTPDGSRLVVAGMTDGSLHVVELATDRVDSYDLPGRAVQTAVLPDGSAAFATIYDTRQVARLDLGARQLTLIDLPAGAAGPVQLYPTPDSRHLWVADQGLLDGRPAGDELYRLDAATGAVDLVAAVAPAPHGVVVNHDGSRVWTTTLAQGTVQAVDGATGQVVSTTPVGNQPNGITCLHLGGVMP